MDGAVRCGSSVEEVPASWPVPGLLAGGMTKGNMHRSTAAEAQKRVFAGECTAQHARKVHGASKQTVSHGAYPQPRLQMPWTTFSCQASCVTAERREQAQKQQHCDAGRTRQRGACARTGYRGGV